MTPLLFLIPLLLAAWAGCFWWHYTENKRIFPQLSAPLRRLLLGRSAQCLLLLAVCFILCVLLLSRPAMQAPAPVLSAPSAPAETAAAAASQSPAIPPAAPMSDAELDSLKERYESVLINHFLLRQCGKSDTAEYDRIVAAMQEDLTRRGAPAEMLQNVVVAAQGSYTEIYSRLPCSKKVVQGIEAKYRAYFDSLRNRR